MLALLAIYFRKGDKDKDQNGPYRAYSANVSRDGPEAAEEVDYSLDEGPQRKSAGFQEASGLNRREFIVEAEKIFASEKDPVFVSDEELGVFYRNRSARKLFGGSNDSRDEPFFSILGAEEKSVRKQLGDRDEPTVASLACQLPNGKEGTAQVRLVILNRRPRVYALRLIGLEEDKPSWLSRSENGVESTSLTRGGHLDFREVDPASVELSADQMLSPLREVDDLLKKVSEAQGADDLEAAKRSLQPARNRLRKMIRHIEEIDWMLQMTDGHLHLRRESFKAYEVLAGMVEAANRLASAEGPKLILDPEEPPLVEPLLAGDRRVFEKILTQLLTSAFRASGAGEIRALIRTEALETPSQSDDWYLFAGEGEAASQATMVTLRIVFERPKENPKESDLPAVVEALGSQIIDPRTTKRLDFVKKGRDSDLFGLTLARELVGKLDGDLAFQSDASGRSEFALKLRFENAGV